MKKQKPPVPYRTFLPKDRDGAVLFIKQEFYDLLHELEAVLARLEHLHNLLDIIERS